LGCGGDAQDDITEGTVRRDTKPVMQVTSASAMQWLAVAAAWAVGAFGGGAVLAWLYKRLHPQLAFYKLWALWTTVLGAVVALLLLLRVFRF
jgi:hypothetical protein